MQHLDADPTPGTESPARNTHGVENGTTVDAEIENVADAPLGAPADPLGDAGTSAATAASAVARTLGAPADPLGDAGATPSDGGSEFNSAPLTSSVDALLGELRALRQDFEAKLQYDRSKERIIEMLHGELEEHRRGLHFVLLRPLLNDLIALYDDLVQVVSFASSEPDTTNDATSRRNLESFTETIEDILLRQGVGIYSVDGDQFDSKRQRASRRVATADPALERCVAERLRKGFEFEGRILRPEVVATYYLDQNIAAPIAVAQPGPEEER